MASTPSSYKQIIKSTGIYGSSQLVNIVFGVIRSKLTAVFLGTTGIGVIGLLQSVIDLSRSVSGLGLDIGATKSLATSDQENESELRKNLYTINVWYLATALLGALFCIVFARPLSFWAFSNDYYTIHIVLLSSVVFLITLSAGITASLQGLRKIGYMALASSISSLLTLLAMIPIFYYWRIKGIVPMYITINIIILCVSYYFYGKIGVKPLRIPLQEVFARGKGMLRLGIFIVVAGVLSTASLFFVRAHINKVDGVDSVGLFQAAWVITTIIWGLVLRSTNTDFFPKLCSLINDREATKTFLNEQTYIILLIISPLFVGLITFSEYILSILYTSDFISATETLRWHLVGAFFKIAVTPIASVMLAKNRGALHFVCELVFWVVYLLSCYLLYPVMGLKSTGFAYFVAYLVYLPVVYITGYKITGARWNKGIIKMLLVNILFLVLLYLVVHQYPAYSIPTGSVILLATLVYSFFKLKAIIHLGEVFRWFKKRR